MVIDRTSHRSTRNCSETRSVHMRIASAVLMFAANCADVLAFSAQPYFPLNEQTSWTYREGSQTNVMFVQPGDTTVNGYPAKLVQQSSPFGYVTYSNDANGVLFHSEFEMHPALPNGGAGPSTLLTLSPPYKLANADITLGQAVVGTGTATFNIGGIGTFAGTYSSSSRPIGFETVTTPLGTFNALRFDQTLTVTITINGEVTTTVAVSSTWVASGIGIVKDQTSTDNGPVEVTELVATNLGGGFPDTLPNTLAFNNANRRLINSVVTSNAAAVSGINVGTTATITGGSYSINDGPFTSEPGIASDGDTVRVRVTASATPGGTACATFNVGTGSSQFCAENAVRYNAAALLPILQSLLED